MMLTEFQILTNDRGSVLIIALLVLVLLTIIGISATTTTTTDIQIASNEKVHSMTFYAADAGIEVGRALLNDLKTADSGNWDNLLDANQCNWEDANGNGVSATSVATGNLDGDMLINSLVLAVGTLNVGPASFQLWVRDNDDLDGDPTVDTDNIIVLRSTGSYQNATVRIETQVRYSGGGDQYAKEHYDTDSSGVAARESGTVADEQRW
jgi:Tfp pilus assembly protein PilX